MSIKSSFKHKTKPSPPSKSSTPLRSVSPPEVHLEAVSLPSVLPASFDELEALLNARKIIYQAAASAAIETALDSALEAAALRHQEQTIAAEHQHQIRLDAALQAEQQRYFE